MSGAPMPANAAPAARPKRIRPGLLIALLAILAATAWSLLQDDEPAPRHRQGAGKAASRQATGADPALSGARSLRSARAADGAAPAAAASSASAALQGLTEQVARWQTRGAFDTLGEVGNAAWSSKVPPPPPPPKHVPPPPPPPPVAPPFPYQWVGRWQEPAAPAAPASASAKRAATRELAVITGPNQTWVVKPGDVIEGQWRIDAITDTSVQLTYLPLSQTQTISMRRT
ncbi:hypothetical protein [Aquabacterium sp.]|uniref:hypothetical protein n=1 Tax=Aquabacterium sp. TaxID=1872578 RepID=UPI0035B24542